MNDAELIATVVTDVVTPTVQRTLSRSHATAGAVDDVVADVRLRLVERIQAWRAGTADPVDNLAGYATTVAAHACYGLLRQQFPNRTRLRNRLRYLVTHHPAMALVEDAPGLWRCHLRKARPAAITGSTQRFIETPREFAEGLGLSETTPTPALIEGLLAGCDGPVEFDRLVDAVATLLGVRDRELAIEEDSADPAPMTPVVLEQRATLQSVWAEVIELPLRQRAALLLNMRDPDGGGVLDLLPGTGVVSMADIAAALEMSPEELAGLWGRLPLDDLTIAARLGITRQQVINLRKSGRARLARRLAGNISGDRPSSGL